jgi:hypothetical protein
MRRIVVVAALVSSTMWPPVRAAAVQSDLDALMAAVLATRDENWKKLRQYILDEREQIDVIGPGNARLWGDRREYTWFIRDGFFVRSPTKANGVEVSDADRRKYEDDFIRGAREREKPAQPADGASAEAPPASADAPASVGGLISQTRQPEFIDSAYFLRFKFESGRYAFVGRETFEGRPVLRIEYYPARLFTHEQNAEDERRREHRRDRNEDVEASMERMMNKVSLVTLWIDADAHQIVKYTFDNIDLDFLPGAWLIRVDDIRASMTMGQPFAGVWLPRDVDMNVRGQLAIGEVGVHYRVDYHDYREATSSGRLIVPGAR